VAPITVHHRVDYAASMIDGRTVGEIAPNSASAREMRDLWLYLQDKLSRAVHDPRLLPDIRPDFAVNSLLESAEDVMQDVPPLAAAYAGPERRLAVGERRPAALDNRGAERRAHVFGRRRGDPGFETGTFK
jgi:hypothetical protein